MLSSATGIGLAFALIAGLICFVVTYFQMKKIGFAGFRPISALLAVCIPLLVFALVFIFIIMPIL